MFDEASESLIRQVPPLSGLDRDRLSRTFTNAYAKLVAIRIKLKGVQGALPEEFGSTAERILRLAQTYEAFAHVLPPGDAQRAAAFVSATAYKLLVSIAQLEGTATSNQLLTRRGVSSSIAAALCFLIAGYTAEAGEIAPAQRGEQGSAADVALAAAIGYLARGELGQLMTISGSSKPITPGNEDEAALDHIWARLLEAVRLLGREILAEVQGNASDRHFDLVYQLTGQRDGGPNMQGEFELGAMPGPHHLAALLRRAGPLLRETALAHTKPPSGVGNKWGKFVQAAAKRRPFLWPSHLAAISSGYLEPGRSAVVSFPTGAGKSIVAEMRVAASLARGGRVLYLAPTHSLVRQIRSDLADAFPKESIRDNLLSTGDYAEVEVDAPPAVAVMTPERCLTLLGAEEVLFADIETIIFDECHLLHADGGATDRRSLDATLCLLRLLAIAPKADVLLMSAMVANGAEIAKWLHYATGRAVEPVDVRWKPTRQARGCLVFADVELRGLNEQLKSERPKAEAAKVKRVAAAKAGGRPMKSQEATVPAALQRQLVATPQALFSLTQTWASRDSDDYSLVQLGAEKVHLAANKFWSLTPNRNVVAADLAARFARSSVKTLIFVQDRGACEPVARAITERLAGAAPPPTVTAEDEALLIRIEQELGGREHSYVDLARPVAVHHSLLLPDERRWNEQRFKRKDGVTVLCATNTLAQGMNLPAEAVIIAGDERFDVASNRMERLEAHELLNAAGRAGRAGANAQGVVLVIPGQVVPINVSDRKIGERWMQLQQDLFSKSDQCLEIRDPLEAILDAVQSGVLDEATLGYFYWRLPLDEDGTVGEVARRLLGTSFAAYRMRERSDLYADCVEKVVAAARAARSASSIAGWQARVMTAAGVSPQIVLSMFERLKATGLPSTVYDAAAWTIAWLREDPVPRCRAFFRDQNLAALIGAPPEREGDVAVWCDSFLDQFEALLGRWVAGETFAAIEAALLGSKAAPKLEAARAFGLNVVGDFAYSVGVAAQVARAASDEALLPAPNVAFATAAACIRDGFDDPFKLAIRFAAGTTRVDAHKLAAELATPRIDESTTFSDLSKAARDEIRARGGISR